MKTKVVLAILVVVFCQATLIGGQSYPGCLPNPPQVIYTMEQLKGSIYSPGFEERKNYPPNMSCSYILLAPYGFKLLLDFQTIDINVHDACSMGIVSIHDGRSKDDSILGAFCGQQNPRPILSQRNEMLIEFKSDSSPGRKGFHINYKITVQTGVCDSGEFQCQNRKCVDESYKCNNIDDCKDGSDEAGCTSSTPPVAVPCGERKIESYFNSVDRISGGRESTAGHWPFMASLQLNFYEPSGHVCGGTLISAQWIVTSAYCFHFFSNPIHWRVHVGKHNKYRTDQSEQTRYVETIDIHPDFKPFESEDSIDMNNDIALVKLQVPIKFTNYIQPACISEQDYMVSSGASCTATGWGVTKGTGADDVLKEVDLSVVLADYCDSETVLTTEKTMICAKNNNDLGDICSGDYGGPLFCKQADKWFVEGIASFGTKSNVIGIQCGVPGSHSVFTRVGDKIEWIKKTMET